MKLLRKSHSHLSQGRFRYPVDLYEYNDGVRLQIKHIECEPWNLMSCNCQDPRFAFELLKDAVKQSTDPLFIEIADHYRIQHGLVDAAVAQD
jgi:hypothetical protein